MHKKNRTEQDFHQLLISNLKSIVNKGHLGLLATINAGAVSLFWEIGAQINNNRDRNSHRGDWDNFTNELSGDLSPVFGEFVNARNLSLMKIFAEKCLLDTVGQIAAAINWEYIPYFLNLEEDNAWLFYTKLMHIKSLDPTGLNKEIEARTFESARINDENAFRLSYSKPFYRNTNELYFGKKNGATFRKLFEPQDVHNLAIGSFLSQNSNNEIVINIYRRVLDFQSQPHYALNLQFNLLLWEVGAEIIHHSKAFNSSVTDSLINNCVQELNKYFPAVFNKEELLQCIKFAEKYKQPDENFEISEIISWPYIKVLIGVESIKEQAFIARQAFNNGTSLQELKRMISDNSFNFEKEGSARSTMGVNNNSVTTTKDGNDTFIITEEIIEPNIHPKHDLNRNIYKNPEMLNFLTNNIYKD